MTAPAKRRGRPPGRGTAAAADHPAFQRFWDAYPTRPHNPRAAASAIFGKLATGGVEPERMIAGAAAYAAYIREQGIDPQWVAHASTWLNRRGWDDALRHAAAAAPPAAPPAAAPAGDEPMPPVHAQTRANGLPAVARANLGIDLSPIQISTWIDQLDFQIDRDRDRAVITAKTRHAADFVRGRWETHLQRVLRVSHIDWAVG